MHPIPKRSVHEYRLLFLHKGKIVWEGMTHEFTTSTNPIVQQVSFLFLFLCVCCGLNNKRRGLLKLLYTYITEFKSPGVNATSGGVI